MSLFDRNPNETAYVHGKKHWADVIKNSGDGNLLIWRQPEEDFNVNSTLIVMPGEQAVFVKNGSVEAVYDNGRYRLNTENYPFISRLRNAFTGGISTFNCVVYFVKTTDSHEILWGTESPIQVRDKQWGILTNVRSYGSYKVHVDDPSMFLSKLIGNNITSQEQEDLYYYFSNQFQSIIVDTLAKALVQIDGELIGLSTRIFELSQIIEPMLDTVLRDYGTRCINYSIASITVDESKYDKIDDAQIEAIAKMKNAHADKGVMNTLGDSWDKQQSVNILGKMAENTSGAGGMMGVGIGMSTGAQAGGAFSAMAGSVFGSDSQNSGVGDPMETMKKLKEMLDAGLITNDEYEKKKEEVLARM